MLFRACSLSVLAVGFLAFGASCAFAGEYHKPPSPEENPFLSGPPGLQACLREAVGEEAVSAFKNYVRGPTATEFELISGCMNRFAAKPMGPTQEEAAPEDGRSQRRMSGDASGQPLDSGIQKARQETDQFIVANPFDLSEISELSPFRSCMGHDYSGWNTDGIRESNRSMKHYVTQQPHVGKVKIMAPFDGKITEIADDGPRGDQIWLTPNADRNWRFVVFHMDLEPALRVGLQVKAGQLIGYSNVSESMNFDITVKKFDLWKGPNIFDSPFHHMSEAVLKEYAQRGVTPENVVISKERRDASPCTFGPGSGMDEAVSVR